MALTHVIVLCGVAVLLAIAGVSAWIGRCARPPDVTQATRQEPVKTPLRVCDRALTVR